MSGRIFWLSGRTPNQLNECESYGTYTLYIGDDKMFMFKKHRTMCEKKEKNPTDTNTSIQHSLQRPSPAYILYILFECTVQHKRTFSFYHVTMYLLELIGRIWGRYTGGWAWKSCKRAYHRSLLVNKSKDREVVNYKFQATNKNGSIKNPNHHQPTTTTRTYQNSNHGW